MSRASTTSVVDEKDVDGRDKPGHDGSWSRARKAFATVCVALMIVSTAFATWVISLGPVPLDQARQVSTSVVDRNGKLLRAYAMADGRWRLPVDAKTAVDPGYLEGIARTAAARGADVLIGVPIRDPDGRYFNSVVSLGASPSQRYDKAHLVPFGEFVPYGFHWIVKTVAIPMSDFSLGRQDPRPLSLAGKLLGRRLGRTAGLAVGTRVERNEAGRCINLGEDLGRKAGPARVRAAGPTR